MHALKKNIVYGYLLKAVLTSVLLFCLYNTLCIFFISHYKNKKLKSKIYNIINTIEFNIKHAGPINSEKTMLKIKLTNKAKGSPWANKIKRTSVFTGPIKLNAKKEEPEEQKKEILLNKKVEVTADTEIIFKGLSENLVYILIRKEIDGQLQEYGFPTKVGEKIGRKKTLGSKTLDFTTNFILQEIVQSVQKPTKLMGRSVILDSTGKFVETRMVKGKTFLKTTSKIKYEDVDGKIKELWLGESSKIVSSDLTGDTL